jgi:hypothetical protein
MIPTRMLKWQDGSKKMSARAYGVPLSGAVAKKAGQPMAWVSKQDHAWASASKWHLVPSGYAARKKNGRKEYLHVAVYGRKIGKMSGYKAPKGMTVDHRTNAAYGDASRMFNVRAGLKLTTISTNAHRANGKVGLSGMRGIKYDKGKNVFVAGLSGRGAGGRVRFATIPAGKLGANNKAALHIAAQAYTYGTSLKKGKNAFISHTGVSIKSVPAAVKTMVRANLAKQTLKTKGHKNTPGKLLARGVLSSGTVRVIGSTHRAKAGKLVKQKAYSRKQKVRR